MRICFFLLSCVVVTACDSKPAQEKPTVSTNLGVFGHMEPEEIERLTAHGKDMRAKLDAKGLFEQNLSITLGFTTSAEEQFFVDIISREWSPELVLEAVRVASCESSLDPNAIGRNADRGIDIGLFQINTFHQRPLMRQLGFTNVDLKDPVKNAQIARLIHERAGGWSDWAPSRPCHGLL